ncbi:metal ABC transporter solute-binding protein, Zn/Mn family [Leptolyngbya sp. KIOST-1]|uniref:metal ABC transporter solute-binding protein, Zn/Mn family n=1 Tax=Leptolyngbya sp. KIOST-1 TaxID=1229172 RepID=UPI0005632AFA|nr:zinc ABC transporter substrate-binding protein [Leptolyngbya sp. KIOST-1]
MVFNPGTATVVRWSGRLGLVLALGLVGCSGDDVAVTSPDDAAAAEAESPVVVATTSVICDLTEQIAETTVALTCLLEPGVDPHTYQVRPSDRQAIEQADLILYDGYNAAPSLIAVVENSTTAAERVAVFEVAVPDPLLGAAHDHSHDHGHDHSHDHGHDHDHDHGHDHDHDHGATADGELVPDPHVWHNPIHNAAMVSVIADSLAQINPDQADFYAENADRLASQFAEIDRWIQAQVTTVPADQRQLVTTHEAFNYFAAAYGFEVKGALSGLSTEERPTPGAMRALVDQVKAAQVPAIFAEDTTNPQLIESVANDAGVSVAEQPLLVEGPGERGSDAETVQAMLVANTCTIVSALGGECDRASAPL